MTWLMGGGMIAGVLGGIFGGIFGGGSKPDGAGGASDKPPVDNSNLKADIKALEKQYPDATFSILSDGSIMCDQEKYESLDEVINALKKNYPKTPEKKDKTTTDNSVKTQADPNLVKNKTDGGKTTTDNGKLDNSALAKLFNETGMAGLKTQDEVNAKFERLAGTKPYKIDTNGDGITINAVDDLGNKTSKADSIKITPEQLKTLKSGEYTTLGTFAGKSIYAQNLDGYLRIKVGDQTYIVGEDGKGYQMENGNIVGFNETNWKYKK